MNTEKRYAECEKIVTREILCERWYEIWDNRKNADCIRRLILEKNIWYIEVPHLCVQ